MTATPIPRTVTMTLFGDLDVSTLRDSPPGRQKVNTYLADDEQRAKWWDFFRRKLREGRQGYVVAPLVEESEQAEAASLEETYETLANGELEAFRLGLIHGRMTPAEKDAVMDRFRRGEIQVLVSTSVVEVGVDVPNATLMTIEERRIGSAWPNCISFAGGSAAASFRAFAACSAIRRPTNRASGSRRSSRRPTASSWPRRIFGCAARANFRHQAARPAAAADRRSAARPAAAGRGPAATPNAIVAADPGLAARRARQAAADDVGALRQGAGTGRRGIDKRRDRTKRLGTEDFFPCIGSWYMVKDQFGVGRTVAGRYRCRRPTARLRRRREESPGSAGQGGG